MTESEIRERVNKIIDLKKDPKAMQEAADLLYHDVLERYTPWWVRKEVDRLSRNL